MVPGSVVGAGSEIAKIGCQAKAGDDAQSEKVHFIVR
jgi:hypothetical protein